MRRRDCKPAASLHEGPLRRFSLIAATDPFHIAIAFDGYCAAIAATQVHVTVPPSTMFPAVVAVTPMAISRLANPHPANRRVDGKLRKRSRRGECGKRRNAR